MNTTICCTYYIHPDPDLHMQMCGLYGFMGRKIYVKTVTGYVSKCKLLIVSRNILYRDFILMVGKQITHHNKLALTTATNIKLLFLLSVQ